MKYIKKFENNISDILQKYHVKFMDFDNNILLRESQIKKLESDINQQKNNYQELVKKCIDDICLYYNFKYVDYDGGFNYENNGYYINVQFADQLAFISLSNRDYELLQVTWNIHSNNTHKFITIFENLEKIMLEDKSKKFNL